MPFMRLSFSRTESEAAIIEAVNAAEKTTSPGWFNPKCKRATVYAIYMVSVVVILWQSRGLHPDAPTASGYLLLSFRVFVVLTLVLASVKLFFNLRDFYSQLHSEEYLPPKEAPDVSKLDGGRGDEQDDFVDFCRREGFPLPEEQRKPEELPVDLGF
ncbi:uncharacterized protein [Dermacentor andersoni]|uniref:uncharacterized protein n=1 Tax=Dermacentor andersoni TaxID=34620 RepID=UPI002155E570|nr:uncharacterized protein LOC126548164 [Dermacentor andersoni]